MNPYEMRPLTRAELAERWHMEPRTLARWAKDGKGPAIFKPGRQALYNFEDVIAFERGETRDGRAEVHREITVNTDSDLSDN